MLNPLLYNADDMHNPTELLHQLYKDINKLSIRDVYTKYLSVLTAHEISGFLLQEVSIECSKNIILYRGKNKNVSN